MLSGTGMGSEILAPRILAVRGDSLEECVDLMNTELRYSAIVMVTSVEYTADEEGFILLATVVGGE